MKPRGYPPKPDAASWDALIGTFSSTHVLQTHEWAQVKLANGWQPVFKSWQDEGAKIYASALTLQRTIPIGGFSARLRVIYVPKGPLLDWSNRQMRKHVLEELQAFARKQGAIFIKIDPEVQAGTGLPGQPDSQEDPLGQEVIADLQSGGWRFSPEQVQFRNTVVIDLAPSEEEILRRMKQKTRYNIHLAERKGVTVRPGRMDDLEMLYRMYAETSVRDGFVIRDESYYQKVWSLFMQSGSQAGRGARPSADPLIAEVEGQPVAAVIPIRFGRKCWYIYGMSREVYREKMPNYLLQWEAMRRAKAAGCIIYDLWGAPDNFDETDSLWGVYRFKEGLGGKVVRTIGAWDMPINPLVYRLYTRTLPRLLGLMRRRGKARTREMLES